MQIAESAIENLVAAATRFAICNLFFVLSESPGLLWFD
jgi:hypothetical protein